MKYAATMRPPCFTRTLRARAGSDSCTVPTWGSSSQLVDPVCATALLVSASGTETP